MLTRPLIEADGSVKSGGQTLRFGRVLTRPLIEATNDGLTVFVVAQFGRVLTRPLIEAGFAGVGMRISHRVWPSVNSAPH